MNDRLKVPVFCASVSESAVILWQVDIAFDERRCDHMQVVKGEYLCSFMSGDSGLQVFD